MTISRCDKITVDAIGMLKIEHITIRDQGKKINVSLETLYYNRSLFEENWKKPTRLVLYIQS